MHISKSLYCVRWCSYKCCVFSLQHVSSLRTLHTPNFCPPSRANDPFDQSTPGFPSFFSTGDRASFLNFYVFPIGQKHDLYTIIIPKYVLNFQLQKFKIQHRVHLWIVLHTSYFMRPPAHLNDLFKTSFIIHHPTHTKKHTASTHSFVAHPPGWRSKQAGSIVTSMRDGNWNLPWETPTNLWNIPADPCPYLPTCLWFGNPFIQYLYFGVTGVSEKGVCWNFSRRSKKL